MGTIKLNHMKNYSNKPNFKFKLNKAKPNHVEIIIPAQLKQSVIVVIV